MLLSRILAVLLSSISFVACNDPQAYSDQSDSRYVERTYRVKEISPVSSDGYLLFKLAEDEDNKSNSGKVFRSHIQSVLVDYSIYLKGTYVRIRGDRDEMNEVDLSRLINDIRILVRNPEQVDQWNDFIQEQKDIIYGPNDVLPPQDSR